MPANQIQVSLLSASQGAAGVWAGAPARERAARTRCLQWGGPSPSLPLTPPPLPLPQYSEKYYDDVFEYRCVAQGQSQERWQGAPKRGHHPSALFQRESALSACPHAPPFPHPLPHTHRHVVLPQDIAQLLPKGKLLSEVRACGEEGRGRALFFFLLCVQRRPPDRHPPATRPRA